MEGDYLRQRNRALETEIEFMRDFIIYLCEEEIEEPVSDLEARFEKWKEQQEQTTDSEPNLAIDKTKTKSAV